MMMAINQPCWDYTPISPNKKMIENHMNVVPNAWLTRKMIFGHLNLIITFAMHIMSMA